VDACPANNAYGNGHMPPSRRIYFFYLTNNPERTRAYFIDRCEAITENDIQKEIRAITAQVKNGLAPVGEGFGAMEFVHKSYFVAVMDDAQQELVPKNAMTFTNKEDNKNKSFKDGKDIQPFDSVTGFYCFNHMKDRHTGTDLGHKSEDFEIAANHRVRGTTGCGKHRAHNDTGTNTGPPLP
jgi:hypothetical protein